MGEKNEGIQILKKHLLEENKGMSEGLGFSSIGSPRIEERKDLRDLFQEIQLHKDNYFQNVSAESNHDSKVDYIQVNPSWKYFASSSKDCVNIWSLTPLKHILKINMEESKVSDKIIAAIDLDGKLVAVYKRFETFISLYEIDLEEKRASAPKTIDIKHELGREVLDSLAEDEFDFIVEVRFTN